MRADALIPGSNGWGTAHLQNARTVLNLGRDCGEVYVMFGPAKQGGRIGVGEGQQDVTIFGADSGDSLGFAVAADDIKGDGIDDVLAGALLADGPGNQRPDAGEIYVIFGSPTLGKTVDIALGEQDLTLFGAGERDRLGVSLAIGDAATIVGFCEGRIPGSGQDG
jgi:hypothetical protein